MRPTSLGWLWSRDPLHITHYTSIQFLCDHQLLSYQYVSLQWLPRHVPPGTGRQGPHSDHLRVLKMVARNKLDSDVRILLWRWNKQKYKTEFDDCFRSSIWEVDRPPCPEDSLPPPVPHARTQYNSYYCMYRNVYLPIILYAKYNIDTHHWFCCPAPTSISSRYCRTLPSLNLLSSGHHKNSSTQLLHRAIVFFSELMCCRIPESNWSAVVTSFMNYLWCFVLKEDLIQRYDK